MKDQIKGGKADNLTPEDLARKHHQFVGTIEKEIELGTKIEMEHTNDPEKAREIAMDHIDEFYDYYSGDNGLINMEKKLENESITNKIKKVLREYTELSITDETPADISFTIMVDDHLAGKIVVRPVKLSESDALEIIKITLTDDFKTIKVIIDAINQLFPRFKDINRLVVSPDLGVVNMMFSGVDWEKAGFTRLNDDYLIRFRGH